MKFENNVVYAERAGFPLAADFALPENARGGPLVVFCHGGGWISGERSMYAEEAQWLASQGIAAATVSYRLAPLHPFPACVADLQDFIIFARGRAAMYGYDPEKIIAVGNSAGGHLAAMLALGDNYYGQGEPSHNFKVNGSVAICPITDLTDSRARHFPISWSFIEQFVGSLEADLTVLQEASPLYHASKLDSPMLLIHGSEDDIVPVSQSQDLHAALMEAGAEIELVVLPGESHSFTLAAWMGIRQRFFEFAKRFDVDPVMR